MYRVPQRCPRRRTAPHDALFGLLSRLAHAPPHELGGAIVPALEGVARFFGVERCWFYDVATDELSVSDAGVPVGGAICRRSTYRAHLARSFPWLVHTVGREQRTVALESLADIPEAGARDRDNCRMLGVRSMLCVPVAVRAGANGHIVALQSTGRARHWELSDVAALRLIGERLCEIVTRARYERGARSARDFERLLVRVSTALARARWYEINAEVERALALTLGYCGVDQALLFEVLPDDSDACLRYLACGPAVPTPPDHFSYREWFPFGFARTVVDGVRLASELATEASGEAAKDRRSMRALGLRSVLHLPLRVEREVRFVLTLARSGRPELPTDATVSRLEALGEILAHAISRTEAVVGLNASQQDVRDALHVVASMGHWEWDIGAQRLHLSDEAKRILGAEVATLAGLMEAVDPRDRAALDSAIAAAQAQPGTRFGARYSVRMPAGDTRVIQQWHEVVFPGERTARLIATVHDVTAMLKREEEINELRTHHWHSARVAQTTLLVASLAHELSQPLSAILNNAQAGLRFMNSGNLSSEDVRDILDDIVASDRRASEVLGILRAMLRRQNTTRVTFDATDAVSDVLALMRSELMTDRIEVRTTLEPGCQLNADKTQIEQVLLNLVMNAADSMRANAEGARCLDIALRCAENGDVQFAVTDTGGGIAPDKLSRVFDAFWTTKKKGLGMGLAVCRAIVESYGGCIACENNGSAGATFRVTIPHSTARQERAAAASQPERLLHAVQPEEGRREVTGGGKAATAAGHWDG